MILMNPRERLERALQIKNSMFELMTDKEADAYESAIIHWNDYISDLTQDWADTQGVI